jgi:hypothetical protein
MPAQHTDVSFRADDVRFRIAGGAVVQVVMRSDFFASKAFFRDHDGRHRFLETAAGPRPDQCALIARKHPRARLRFG